MAEQIPLSASKAPVADPEADAIIRPCFNVSRGRIRKILASGRARDLSDIRILSRAAPAAAGANSTWRS